MAKAKKLPPNAQRNARLAWLSQQVGRGQTDAAIIIALRAAYPSVSEATAKSELKMIYQRLADYNDDNWADQKHKCLEVAWAMLDEMRQLCQYGPAANHFKTIATLSGALTEKTKVDLTIAQDPAPDASIVRDRITKLASQKKILERAKKAGLDLDLDCVQEDEEN